MEYSVIIPVYNAEKTLRRCLDSLLRQDCSDVEIILVNDGSKDDSLEVCREYERGYSFIRVIDKENGGVSSARNAGLDLAEGTYVLFVDSDDYVPTDLFSKLNKLFKERDWDLIRLSNCVDNGHEHRERIYPNASFDTRAEALTKIIDDICRKYLNTPWAKVYRREVLDRAQIRFPLGVSVAEDRAFNINYSLHIQSYRVSDQVAYFVNTENENSLSRKRHDDLLVQFAIADAYTDEAILKSGIDDREKELYRQAINFAKCRSIYKTAKDLRRDGFNWPARQKALWKKCLEINRKRMKYPATSYCLKITLPVRLYLVSGIDLIAKRLLR